jgi:hypothetical protein
MTLVEFNEVVENLRISEWSASNQDALGRVIAAAGQVIRNRLKVPGLHLTPEAVAEFIDGLSPRQMRLLKRIAEAQLRMP